MNFYKSEKGDVKLVKGDCLEVMDMMIAKGVIVDAIITDPPYGTTACKWDSVIPFDEMWLRLNKLIKPSGAIVLFGSEPFSSALRMSNIKNYKYDWKWDKVNSGSFATARYKPLPVFEDIIIFGKKKLNYYPIMEEADKNNMRPRGNEYKRKTDNSQGMSSNVFKSSATHDEKKRYPKNRLVYNKNKGDLNALNRLHPTQKPVALMEYLIKTYTNENETVLDFTIGSGSTGVACVNTNRNFIGIEMDETYFNIAQKRIKDTITDKGLK
jgi:site-specific DNA-methyltransferase (adenine-specific)